MRVVGIGIITEMTTVGPRRHRARGKTKVISVTPRQVVAVAVEAEVPVPVLIVLRSSLTRER